MTDNQVGAVLLACACIAGIVLLTLVVVSL